MIVKSPYPWFGGKSSIMPDVWKRLGDPPNFIDPFLGSDAPQLSRPGWDWTAGRWADDQNRIETVNDKDCFVSNFWRGINDDPEQVAHYADWPVNECVPEGTMIATPEGNIPIENIKPGMKVLGEKDGKIVETNVIATKNDYASNFVKMDDLLITPNHPVWTMENGYIEAGKLPDSSRIAKIDWRVSELDLFIRISVSRVSFDLPQVVYNFQTTSGNYFANDILVHNCDLHARHLWLVNNAGFIERMKTDPDYYDPKVAGWWVWGICQWIGAGWCSKPECEQLPHLLDAGMGIHRPSQQLPHLGDAGRGDIYEYFAALSARLRRTRVCCGDWRRVLGPTPTEHNGLTAIILDPPYSAEAKRKDNLYAQDDLDVAHDVRRWAIENGDNPKLRIALFGYEDEHSVEIPPGWRMLAWKAKGGYGNQGNGNGRHNATQERVWFSPHCLDVETASQARLFA